MMFMKTFLACSIRMGKLFFTFNLLMIAGSVSATVDNYDIANIQHTFTDPDRNDRPILTEIYYPVAQVSADPENESGYPLLIFGHGFVMVWSAYENLWTDFVPRGYVMAFPRTETSFSPSHQDFGLDIAFLVNAIQAMNDDPESELYQKLSGKTALMGHSMGGGASVLAAAQHPDIHALLALAPAETNPSAIAAASNVSVPALIFAGSSDDVTPEEVHQIPIYQALPSESKTYISITGGGHCYFANFNFNCNIGELGSSGNITVSREEQQETTSDFANLWLDYFLKDDCEKWSILQDSLLNSDRITYMQEDVIAIPEISLLDDSLVSTPASTYQWLLDGDPLPGANGQSILPVESGDYQVEVTYFNACKYLSEPYHLVFEPDTYTVTFSIINTAGDEVSDAMVTLNSITNAAGDYVFPDIEPGVYDFLVERGGYLDYAGQISVFDDNKDVEVVLIFDETGLTTLPSGINVYPNPSRGKITIESDAVVHSVLLINLHGQVVLRKAPSSKQFSIFADQLQHGLYLLRLNTGYEVITRKIEIID